MSERIVELKPRPRDRVTVTLSGGRFFTIPAERAEGLTVGVDLSDDDLAQLERIDQYFRGKEKAIRLLALRPRTRREVRDALTALGIDAPIRDGIVGELEELGLVDDERFAREFVRVRADVKSMGPHRLRYDLARRGVSAATVDSVVAEEIDPERQEAMARDLAARKLGGVVVDEGAVRRIAGLLRRKGYDYEIVNRIAYELLQKIGREPE